MAETLLIQPPALIPSEPPLALAILVAALRREGLSAETLDANLGAYLSLLDESRLAALAGLSPSRAISRALNHRHESLALLRSEEGARSFSRYSTAVRHLNVLLGLHGGQRERLTFSDYQYAGCSPFDPAALECFGRGELHTLFHPYFRDELLPRIFDRRPKRVALSINYRHQAFPAFELAGLLRCCDPQLEIVGGGGLLTSWQQPLQRRGASLAPFDRIVFGPGEASLIALARGQGGDSYFVGDVSTRDFIPDFSEVNFNRYLSPRPILPLGSSRGCYWEKCLFCPEATAPIHPYGYYQDNEFPDLLNKLSCKYKVNTFHLTDNAIPMNILRQLARRYERMDGLAWFGFVRFEKALTDPDFVMNLAAGGCRMLQLGLESGSQVVLDRLRKGIRLENVVTILENLFRAGIKSYVYIMLGSPGENEADAEMTLRFLETHAEKINFLNIAIMNLPRGSDFLDDPQLYGIDSSKLQGGGESLGLYHTFQSGGGWDRRAARRFLNQRLLKSPAIRDIVKHDPPVFSSSHAVFFG